MNRHLFFRGAAALALAAVCGAAFAQTRAAAIRFVVPYPAERSID
ncbi:hypothetical protein [Variovorax sp. Sphag1AA]|nr:hypothetical protein [Variovorax sp. Sphag1AA]MBB3182051.1 hypothetical protein [Variovorax sp. Sphag1AA]